MNENARQMLADLAEFNEWQNVAASKGWKLPGNSPLPNHSWLHYWKSMAAYEADPSGGRPVVPHRSGNSGGTEHGT
jgi:hypothetical protein